MNDVFKKIEKAGIIPVVVIEDSENAVALGNALLKGGLSCVEITFRTDAAEESIKLIKRNIPDMLIGAGTVLTVEQVDKAVNAGASFIVAPGFNPKVVSYCLKKGYPVIPGVVTPSEIEAALDYGLTVLKFFPAQQSGGVEYLKAISAPYSMVKFLPTGGISADNLGEYLKLKQVIACGGSWMVKQNLITEKKFSEIEMLTANAVKLVDTVRK